MSEKDIVNLRRTIYLVIMNSVDFEECMHKLLKMNIGEGNEEEVCNMLIECAAQERTYLRFYGLLAQRFAEMFESYKVMFECIFENKYQTIHRYETNKLRNMAKFYAHMLYTLCIDWHVFSVIRITHELTTSSSRIFVKILL
jgi:pre-mRNA-splicing factor CWC22